MPDFIKENLLDFEADAKADKQEVEKDYAEMWTKTEDLVARLTKGYSQPGNLIRSRKAN